MSATHEAIMEKIRFLTKQLADQNDAGIDTSETVSQLNELKQQASAAQAALNEGKLLKG